VADRGIGRGLAAILPSAQSEETFERIPLDMIRPNRRQPRRELDEPGLAALAESIGAQGVLQPVVVTALAGGAYELIAGERRWRAARLAGLDRIPAVVRTSEESERLELALVENMAREDLNALEAARGCAALVDELGLTKEDVARKVGKSRPAISNLIRLLELPDEVIGMLESGELSEGHGRAILQAPGRQMQRTVARAARDRGLSVRETEALARTTGAVAPRLRSVDGASVERAEAEAVRQELEEGLTRALGVEARVRLKRRGCSVEIHLDDLEAVRDLADRLAARQAS
jgi:ParB family transcriptional regulator, chromosome partitioning protein